MICDGVSARGPETTDRQNGEAAASRRRTDARRLSLAPFLYCTLTDFCNTPAAICVIAGTIVIR